MDSLRSYESLRERAYTALGESRGELGQFYTPAPVAKLLGSMIKGPIPKSVRLLEPGAGVGILSAAAVSQLIELGVAEVELTCCEISQEATPLLKEGLRLLGVQCKAANVRFTAKLVSSDFVEWSVKECREDLLESGESKRYDVVILNPPYKKINTSSHHRKLMRSIGLECTNLYAAFIYLSARLLANGGQLVSINPRSFANGPYFKNFRKQFFKLAPLHDVHVFSRRDKAFSADDVLQENVVLRAVRGTAPEHLNIHTSESGESVDKVVKVPMSRVLNPEDEDLVLHLETTDDDANVASLVRRLPATLADLALTVSTGRVVDFRARNALSHIPQKHSFPLIYPAHLRNAGVEWPKESKKPDYFCPNEEQKPQLVPAGNYVLTKRFSSKEEKRRIVASIITTEAVPGPCYAFENHINYFHENGEPLNREIALGLAAFLNSTLADKYFRIYNGHTQVNATDLRAMRFPSKKDLKEIGKALKTSAPTTVNSDSIVQKLCLRYASK